MSSTHRGTPKTPFDDFPTPRWCVHRLLESYPLPAGTWVEPCAGAGNIINAVNERRSNYVLWRAVEINKKYARTLRANKGISSVLIGDALKIPFESVDVIITNPPFSIAEELLRHFLRFRKTISLRTLGVLHLPHIIFLQRLNWCAGPRAALFRELKPSVYVLPNRPSFTGRGVDSTEYAWFVFDGEGRFAVLNDTPAEVRKAEAAHARSVYQKPMKKKPTKKKPKPKLYYFEEDSQ